MAESHGGMGQDQSIMSQESTHQISAHQTASAENAQAALNLCTSKMTIKDDLESVVDAAPQSGNDSGNRDHDKDARAGADDTPSVEVSV